MIEHISLRCRNAGASRTFYEQALAPLGYKMDRNYGDAFGFIQGGRHDFWISNGKVGTPNHVAFHAKPREEYGYAAFVLDPDGHNIEAVIWDEELKQRKSRRRRRVSA